MWRAIWLTSLLLVSCRSQKPEEPITKFAQTGPDRRPLSSLFLEEILGLSIDCPATTYDTAEGEKKLLAQPFIKWAQCSLLDGGTFVVDYTVRAPIAWLADFDNIAFDVEGHLFPITPYLTPKKLPALYLGIDAIDFAAPLSGPRVNLGRAVLDFLAGPAFTHLDIDTVDVSSALAPSLGRREIVVILKHRAARHFLRLTPDRYKRQLENYLNLSLGAGPPYKELLQSDKVIDLRLEGLGFVQDISIN
ncbi:MAG: hypothetical protein MRY21_07825 [Simkaniaceae bacterium]|nr:hypothetical protein [Simkaniaceae bacterium]